MAIVKPEEMNFSDKNIIMIISGLPGVGKTTLALSAPEVVLIDSDEGLARVKVEHRKDSSIVKTYEELLADIKSCEGKYKTMVIDTCGALIDLLKDWAMRNDPKANKASGGFSLQGFGIIKQEFLRFSAELRKNFNVIYLFHAQKEKDNEETFYSLVCEGSARTLVYQPADLAAYMFIQNGERYLGFTPTAQYSAKSAYGIKGLIKTPELAEGEPNDFLTKLFAKIRENLLADSATTKTKQLEYDAAMVAGKALINCIDSPDLVIKTGDEIKRLKHSLTSEKELAALMKAKVKELGYVYNPKTKAYEQA